MVSAAVMACTAFFAYRGRVDAGPGQWAARTP